MVLSSALRNENLLSASGNTCACACWIISVAIRIVFFSHVPLLYLCFTYPCLLPVVISSSLLSVLPTFKYSSISCQLAQVLTADRGTYCLLVREQSPPPNTGKLTREGAICGAPPGTVGHVVWCCSAVAFLCS